MVYELADFVLYPWEITEVLNVAIILCPAMKRHNCKMYPQNAKIAVPSVCVDEERSRIVALLLNDLTENCA